jgi:hypothetical protein
MVTFCLEFHDSKICHVVDKSHHALGSNVLFCQGGQNLLQFSETS